MANIEAPVCEFKLPVYYCVARQIDSVAAVVNLDASKDSGLLPPITWLLAPINDDPPAVGVGLV